MAHAYDEREILIPFAQIGYTPDAIPPNPLTDVREKAHYNTAEGRFSFALKTQVDKLLKGERDSLFLLRKYPGEPNRLSVPVLEGERADDSLRMTVVEGMMMRVIAFVKDDSAEGGPIAQVKRADGDTIETRVFPTRFPHILIERTDHYKDQETLPEDISLRLKRVQNQRAETRRNRVVDAASMVIDLARLLI